MPTADACLTADELAAWVDRSLDEPARERALAHVSHCDVCREASSLLAGLEPSAAVSAALPRAEPAASSDSAVPALGSQLGRFRIEQVIGKGGMGVVLRAHDPQLNRDVAIKLVQGVPLASQKGHALSARLAGEAKALAALSHPNLVAVYEAGEHEARPFVVMELVVGDNLRAHVALERPPWRVGLALCLAAGRGLSALHAAGFIHRDIKPDNLLVANDGRVLVADLGLAKRIDPAAATGGESDAPVTRTGAIVGTPRYLAPERVAGQPGDIRSDVYAFAATTLEVARSCAGTLPARVTAVLSKGMDPDPQRRFGSIDELSKALQRAAGARRLPLAIAGTAVLSLAVLAVVQREGPRPIESAPAGDAAPIAPAASGSAASAPSASAPGDGNAPANSAAGEAARVLSASALALSTLSVASSAPAPPQRQSPPLALLPDATDAIASAAPVASAPTFSVDYLRKLGRVPITTQRAEEALAGRDAECVDAKEASIEPRGVDWGKVERSGVAQVEDKDGKLHALLLYQVLGQRKRYVFVALNSDQEFLDVPNGDWVFVCPRNVDTGFKLPADWKGDFVGFPPAFGPIAGPPAFATRSPRPTYLRGLHLSPGDDPWAPGRWTRGAGPFLFSVKRPPSKPLDDGRVKVEGGFLELPPGAKGLGALDTASAKRPVWVVGTFVGLRETKGSELAVIRVDEVLPSLFTAPPAKRAP